MYQCYICKKLELTVSKFRTHLFSHNDLAELILPILCCQGSCRSSFSKVSNFIRHINTYHVTDNNNLCFVKNVDSVIYDSISVAHDDNSDTSHINGPNVSPRIDVDSNKTSEVCLSDVRTEAVALVAGLRANSSIPYSVIPSVVDSFNFMASSMTDCVKNVAEASLREAGIEDSKIMSVCQIMTNKLQSCEKPVDFLNSVYKQDKYFEQHKFYVKPESVCFDARWESHNGTSKLVYDTFQYVSVEKTLKSLLHNKAYVEALLEDRHVSGVYQDYMDGDSVSQHSLFGNTSKFSIMIQLFYDGLGTTNPLRGQNVVNNIGVFFYTIKNLPMQFNSCFANVHLLALCYAQDLKVYGFNQILDKFVDEINLLQTNGFECELPVTGVSKVYASLCQVTCDNLALNGMLGFIESFSTDYFCTMCYATQDEIQKFFRAECFKRRTIADYNVDVSNIPAAKQLKKNHSKGVKSDCVLNKIDGYHVTENWSLDIMHILLEGIIPVEIGCVLYGLCFEYKLIDLATVNQELHLFWGQLTVNKGDKPPALNKLLEPGQGLTPSMKAIQHWSMLKYLPLAIGRLIPAANKHWKFLLHLSHLVDLIFAPRFTLDTVLYLTDVIEEHLTQFIELYSSTWNAKLRPKHHLLVHLPSIILKSGPLTGMSCMRYELKNSFFKRSAHTVCNFTNICYTLARRHQQQVLHGVLSNSHIRNATFVGQQFTVPVCTLAFCNELCTCFGIEATDDIDVASKLSVATTRYAKGNCVVIDCSTENNYLIFGRITTFVCSMHDEWHMVLEVLQTDDYRYHYHAFSVSDVRPPVYQIVRIPELVDHHPLHCCSLTIGDSTVKLIRVPYHVFKLKTSV